MKHLNKDFTGYPIWIRPPTTAFIPACWNAGYVKSHTPWRNEAKAAERRGSGRPKHAKNKMKIPKL